MKNEELIVVKRSGQRVPFNGTKIALAIKSAFDDTDPDFDPDRAGKVYKIVLKNIDEDFAGRKTIAVEDIQDQVERGLNEAGETGVSEAFRSYRLHRAASRGSTGTKKQHKFARAIESLSGLKENEDLCPAETLKQIGDIVNREYAKAYLIDNKYVRADADGLIHIDHLSGYALGKPLLVSVDPKNCCKNGHTLSDLEQLLSALAAEVSETIVVRNFDDTLKAVRSRYLKNILKSDLKLAFRISGLTEFVPDDRIDAYVDDPEKIRFSSPVLMNLMKTCFAAAESASEKKLENKVAHFRTRLAAIESASGVRFVFRDDPEPALVLASVSVNLPRLAYEDKKHFEDGLKSAVALARAELKDDFEFLGDRTRESYSALFTPGILPKSEDLEDGKKVRKCIRSGALSISLIGTARAAELTGLSRQQILSIAREAARDEKYNFDVNETARGPAAACFLKTNRIIFGDRVTETTYAPGPGGAAERRST